MTGYCEYCGTVATAKKKLLMCSACTSVSYCNKTCQSKHWPVHQSTCSVATNTKGNNGKGTGYGGGAGDQKQRAAGKKQAAKRETQQWAEWQQELGVFCAAVASPGNRRQQQKQKDKAKSILNTLKQVLRSQAPDWWWQQPQRKLHEMALQASQILTEHYPQWWGDPDDEESAIAALEELARTSQVLIKQLANEKTATGATTTPPPPAAAAPKAAAAGNPYGAPTRSNKKRSATAAAATTEDKSTHDKDDSLLLRVIQIRKDANQAIQRPECSIMDSAEFYRQALRPLAFDMVESFDMPPHFYTTNAGYQRGKMPSFYGYATSSKKAKKPAAKASNKKTQGPGPSAHSLWKELSTYPTALPIEYGSSIFVRAQEGKMDTLRVLIIGPDDTPYGNGIFIFDVTLGEDYPHQPPKVQFLTTSSFLSASDTKVRFNPNLYECGKVCLSLLGTWSGPGWTSGESNLFQVLVSLQSLILGTEEPYFNEPGYESSQGTAHGKEESDEYNRDIRQYTLRVALLPFLQNEVNQKTKTTLDPPGTNAKDKVYYSEFGEVIRQHFRLKQRVIQKQLFQWYQEDPSLEPLYSEFWNLWDQLQQSSESNKKPAATAGAKRKREATGAKENADGVIEIDDADDEVQARFESETELALKMSLGEKEPEVSTKRKGKAGRDNNKNDDDDNRKPAARNKNGKAGDPSGVKQNTNGIIEIDDDDDEVEEVVLDSEDDDAGAALEPFVPVAHAAAAAAEFVDLT